MLLPHIIVILHALLAQTEHGILLFLEHEKVMSLSITLPLEIFSSSKIETEEESGQEKETDLVFHEWNIQVWVF